MATHTFWSPPKALTEQDRTLIRSHARQAALASLGPHDPRLDELAAQLAYIALSYARHKK